MAATALIGAGSASNETRAGDSWNTPSNATVDDTSTAIRNFGASGGDYLACYNFGFGIDAGATIDGILARGRYYETSGGARDLKCALWENGAAGNLIAGGDTKTDNRDTGGTAEDIDFGGAADAWSLSLTGADVNDAGFGCAFWVETTTASRMEYVEMQITYTPAATDQTGKLADGGLVGASLVGRSLVHRTMVQVGHLWAPPRKIIRPRLIVPVGIALQGA